jgi:hypothetical protein
MMASSTVTQILDTAEELKKLSDLYAATIVTQDAEIRRLKQRINKLEQKGD